MHEPPNRPIDLVPAQDLTPRITRVTARIDELGIRIHPSSPLGAFVVRHEQFVQKAIGVPVGPESDIIALGEGGRYFLELEIVVDELLSTPPDPAILDKLRSALGGSVLPSQDRDTHPRDTLYELLLGALLKRWGARVIFGVRPDLIATMEGTDFGVEAKRLTNAEQIQKRMSKARRQLEEVPLPGIVALSVDRLLAAGRSGLADPHLTGPTLDALVGCSHDLAHQIFTPRLRQRAIAKAKPPIAAILVTATVPAMVPTANGIGIVTSHHLSVVAGAKPTHRQVLGRFFNRVMDHIGSEGRLRAD
jgi:hypothetical protein